MIDFLRKIKGTHQPTKTYKEDTELEQFFTDAEHAKQVFGDLVSNISLPKHLILIHGIGAIGKSSLLKMYRLHCKKIHIPVALTSCEDTKSEASILSNWVNDLKADGIELKKFEDTIRHYRAIESRVDGEKLKELEKRGKAADFAGKVVIKTTEATTGAAIGAVAGSVAPGLGTVVGAMAGAIIGTSAEEFRDFLRSFLSKSDTDLYIDPKKLTDDFLSDISQVAQKRRIVLMLDTFEQIKTLSGWLCDIGRHLPENIVLVIAGRGIPEWCRAWPGWMMKAEIIEMKEMEPDDLRKLVCRYYALTHGGKPNSNQVEAIVQFARGLPMVATTVVKLWVRYPKADEDFKAVKPQVVADLVDRLLEGVPNEMKPSFEAAAVLRYFNADSLCALSVKDADKLYDELRRWPFIRSSHEIFLSVHDTMREMISEALHMRTPERFHTLNKLAAEYYEAQLAKDSGENAESLRLERLYHLMRTDEKMGMRLFNEMAEELARYGLVSRLRALLSDVNTYLLERKNSQMWRKYYNARLAHLEARLTDAEQLYKDISENDQSEPKLKGLALCRWGEILERPERTTQHDGWQKAHDVLRKSLEFLTDDDSEKVTALQLTSGLYIRTSPPNWNQAEETAQDAVRVCELIKEIYGIEEIHKIIRGIHGLKQIYALQGRWSEYWLQHQKGLELAERYREYPFYKMLRIGASFAGYPVALVWMGRYQEVEKKFMEFIKLEAELSHREKGNPSSRDHFLAIGMQIKNRKEVNDFFQKKILEFEHRGSDFINDLAYFLGFWGMTLLRAGEIEQAEKCFKRALDLSSIGPDPIHILEWGYWLGMANETKGALMEASQFYEQSLAWRTYGRYYFECGSLTGLTRILYAQGNYKNLQSLLNEAEKLAQQHEYNDHLASLRLTQGHITWDSQITEWGSVFDTALRYYQRALIHALLYNRFLLDEVLSGGPQGTELSPIIPCCIEHGEEGQKILFALRDWWNNSINDIDKSRPCTISPILDNVKLKEAERIAREREPGDGSPQSTVVEQIEAALHFS